MTQLGEFDLQLALVGTGTLCKYVQYQRGPIQHAAFALFFDIAFLDRGERPADDDQVGLVCRHLGGQFVDFSAAHEKTRVRPVTRRFDHCGDIHPRGTAQFLELIELFRPGIRKKRM